MKKILITGNSGYIGSHLCKMLNEEYEIIGLDINKPLFNIKKHLLNDIKKPLPKIKDKFDAVIHLAAVVNVGESERVPTDYYMTNLIGTLNILNWVKTDNFIFASTGAAEKCESAYGTSKKAAEDCIKEFCNFTNLPYTIFRFYNVIGSDGFVPTNQDGLMYNLLNAKDTGKFTVFGEDYDTRDGTCIRDYVHVNEICDAIRTAIEKPSNSIENLGHGVGFSVKEMVSLFELVNDCKIDVKYGPRRKGDIEASVLDNPSSYIQNLYKIQDLLKVEEKVDR
jgi:UDP-glucose 4-epimerase